MLTISPPGDAYGPDDTYIANGCAGSGPLGRCNFSEFVQHVISQKWLSDYLSKEPKSFITEEPHEQDVQEKLYNSGFRAWNAKRLLPKFHTGAVGDMTLTIEKITNVMQAARKHIGDTEDFEDAKIAMKEACNQRLAVNMNAYIADMGSALRNLGAAGNVVTEDIEIGDGTSVSRPNLLETIIQNKISGGDLKTLVDWSNGYFKDTSSKGTSHKVIIENYEIAINRLESPPDCDDNSI